MPDTADFLHRIDSIRVETQKSLEIERQSELGQFFSPPAVAKTMAGMFSSFPSEVRLIDPGAGVGTLTAAFVSSALSSFSKPKSIRVTAYEIDSNLVDALRLTLEACQALCQENKIEFQFKIITEDFIVSSVELLSARNTLFALEQPDYNFSILNPPYKKINSESKIHRLLRSVGIETTNLYTAFFWLIMKFLPTGGELAAIIPRSFCNGAYFRPFREDLLDSFRIRQIHIYNARDKAFKEGNVLQENIIIHASKNKQGDNPVIISSSNDPEDENIQIREVSFSQLVHPDDPEKFIRIVPDRLGSDISQQINNLSTSLKDLGLSVSTGKVVDFRSRHLIKQEPDTEVIPLIYPGNLKDGSVIWPRNSGKKPAYLASAPEVENLAIPVQFYVLVKRFSSKEERRRIYAALFDPKNIPGKRVGLENHINYFHSRYSVLSIDLAKGLVAYLNSTLVDQYFRQFSGHTQVNATDLKNIKYPSEKQLLAIGKRIADEFQDQDTIDDLIEEELELNNKETNTFTNNPIRAKKKIREALSILHMLAVPRAQQNDRSALTLLALVNIKADSSWDEASENLIGITEMMDFFRANYGVNYAPNTRETVRRQTIHQFLQMGLAIPNPDDPNRPINSPKTRYVIEPGLVTLIRSFGSVGWDGFFREYLKGSAALTTLQVRERTIPMIPVTLPDGDQIMLSRGGQNNLIKSIIEEFCPRFTPGGQVIYIGDAGQKLTEQELKYFDQLGIKIDKHGKMPDVIIVLPDKEWMVLVEAVTSHGPIDLNRHHELKSIFGIGKYGLVYVSAFESRKSMHKFLIDLAWETEVWVSEAPSHLIHFNGERFLGPYNE